MKSGMKITPDWLRTDPLQFVLGELADGGHQAYVVGGCVRDAVMGLPVSDIDIATDRTPDDVEKIFTFWDASKLIPTGVDHGTWTVVVDGVSFEVTTFRKDVATDGRNATVAYAKTMEEDAMRRDFTMNAMYMDYQGNVYDPTGKGISDILSRTVRFVGDADERCREDYLRILRLFRFHAKYGKGPMDSAAYWAAANNAEGLSKVSGERIWSELKKLLDLHDPVDALIEMDRSKVLNEVLPGYASISGVADVCYVERTGSLGPKWERRYAAMRELSVEPIELPHSNAEEEYIRNIIAARVLPAAHAAFIYKDGNVAFDSQVLYAAATRAPWTDHSVQIERGLKAETPVNARMLMQFGVEEGPKLGFKLRMADKLFLQSGLTATKEELLTQLKLT